MENKRGGFTLVEVMTAILLFGMLMLLIFPMRRMMVRVLERTGDQEHAEMIGDAVFRHVTDGLQTVQNPGSGSWNRAFTGYVL